MEENSFRYKLHIFLNKLGTIALMNAMYLIASIPIVTIGPAWNGLLTAVRYHVRGDKWFAGFKFGFKKRFWRSFLSWNLLLLPTIYFLDQVWHCWNNEYLVPLIASGVVFVLISMFLSALLVLNVYIPTPIGRWIRNAGDLIKSAHIKLAGVALAYWLPLILFVLAWDIFSVVLILFLVAYYALVGFATTLFLKDNLVLFLVDARKEGILLAEEGRVRTERDEKEEE